MPELDPFEARLTAAVHAFADRAETNVDPAAVAERTPRGRQSRSFAWLGLPLPVPAWIVLLAGLLLAALLGATMVGGAWRDGRTSLVPPASPSPSATAAPIAEIDLANVRAHAVAPAATCPPGTSPDTPGPAHRVWPAEQATSMAFDRQSGKIVALVTFPQDPAQTWTFDVCTNTWVRKEARPSVSWTGTLVYDVDSDRTILLAHTPWPGQVPDRLAAWSYDLEGDRWVQGATSPVMSRIDGDASPGLAVAAAYHDPSGLVVVYDGTRAWAYDVEADAWTALSWEGDWARPSGVTPMTLAYDPARDRFVVNIESMDLIQMYGETEHRTMTLVPATGKNEGSLPGLGFFCGWAGELCSTVFDEGTGRVVWTNGGSHVEAWSPEAEEWGAWEMLYDQASEEAAARPTWCGNSRPAADPLHGRIVCRGEAGSVAAFTPATRTWQWLLAPQE